MRAANAGVVIPGRSATKNFNCLVASMRLAAVIHGSSQERPVGINTPA